MKWKKFLFLKKTKTCRLGACYCFGGRCTAYTCMIKNKKKPVKVDRVNACASWRGRGGTKKPYLGVFSDIVGWPTIACTRGLIAFFVFFLFYRPKCEFTNPPNGSRGSCRCRDRERRFVREQNSTCVCRCTALVIDHGQYRSLLYFVFGWNESARNQLGAIIRRLPRGFVLLEIKNMACRTSPEMGQCPFFFFKPRK